MKKDAFIILGAGHFGRRALQKTSLAFPGAPITIVDHQQEALTACQRDYSVNTVNADGITYLTSLDNEPKQYLWIIPSIPIHVVFEWSKTQLTQAVCHITVPDEILQQLPNPVSGKQGTVYMSHASFRCPDNCPEPVDHCFVTGQTRTIALYEQLAALNNPLYLSIVIQSHQLMPGVGGFKFDDLKNILPQIESSTKPVLLSTACRCHGVMNGFSNVQLSI